MRDGAGMTWEKAAQPRDSRAAGTRPRKAIRGIIGYESPFRRRGNGNDRAAQGKGSAVAAQNRRGRPCQRGGIIITQTRGLLTDRIAVSCTFGETSASRRA